MSGCKISHAFIGNMPLQEWFRELREGKECRAVHCCILDERRSCPLCPRFLCYFILLRFVLGYEEGRRGEMRAEGLANVSTFA